MTSQTTTSNPAGAEPRASQPASPSTRSIDGVYRPDGVHWVGDGFRVAGYFAAVPDAVKKLSPFLLLDYHPPYNYAPTSERRGVGTHPHRGFETVTFAWQGRVAHRDSAGGGGVIGPGDVQWMTAAQGILHNEFHDESYGRVGGPFHMAQLWVNLPRKDKMGAPGYQPLAAADMGVVELADEAGRVRVIAGQFNGVKGPARTFTPIDVFDAELRAKGQLDLSFPAHHNTAVLVMSGEAMINEATEVTAGDMVVFKNDGEGARVAAASDCHLLVLSGEPINEPIVQYGPFVMNSEREIIEAIDDLNSGRFGAL